jgi:hypothetical protein
MSDFRVVPGTREAEPAESEPSVQGTRVADATGTSGHVPTGANVAGILDQQMRRTTTLVTTKRLVLVSFSPARWSRG